MTRYTLPRLALRFCQYALFALAFCLLTNPASAQRLVARVNGSNITSFDVDQRVKLERLVANKQMSGKEALDLLIDERLKLQEGRRIGFKVTEDDVDSQLNRIASNNHQTKDQLEQALRGRGVDPIALRDRIKADLVWSSLLPYKVRSTAASNQEINEAINEKIKQGKAKVSDYVVSQIIFVVPGGTPAMAAQRQRDAQAARSRFTDCESGLLMMRTLRDVAVRGTVSRSSSDLSQPMNDLINKTSVGHLTEPYRTDQGIEMLAICEKRERNDESAVRSEVEGEINRKRSETSADSIVKDLRSKAAIERF